MLVSYVCDTLQVYHIQFRVANKFGKYGFGLFIQLGTHCFGGDFGNESRFDAEGFQIMEQVDCAAKKAGASNDFVACLQNVQKRNSYCGHARRTCHGTDSLFKGCDAGFPMRVYAKPGALLLKTASSFSADSCEKALTW